MADRVRGNGFRMKCIGMAFLLACLFCGGAAPAHAEGRAGQEEQAGRVGQEEQTGRTERTKEAKQEGQTEETERAEETKRTEETERTEETKQTEEELAAEYRRYKRRLEGIEQQSDLTDSGFDVIEDQIFPLETAGFGSVSLVPAIEEQYHRLVLFLTNEDGTVVYRTDELAVNHWREGKLEQTVQEISAISFLDLNHDGLSDIVLLAACKNEDGAYTDRNYKVGDVLFQNEDGFYYDYRISDRINRFGMNQSARSIIAHVRGGASTEFLYTASTKEELLKNGFVVAMEQDYFRQFEKLGYLEVLPGTYTIADCSVFMVYLVDEQGNIVWSFQPMGDFDNLYALKGIVCTDIDGDGMKDLLVFAGYNYADGYGAPVPQFACRIYYQRTDGFETDTEVTEKLSCGEEDTAAGLVERARAYWGWSKES